MEKLWFDASDISACVGIQIADSDRAVVRDCNFVEPSVGIMVFDNVHDLMVVNNISSGDGYFFLGYHPMNSARWNISNNSHRGDLTGSYGGIGISLDAMSPGDILSDAVIANNLISNCHLVGYNGGIGIALAHCEHVTVSANVISGCNWEGIHVEDNSTDLTIAGNYCYNNDWAGIDVMPLAMGGNENIVISNNICRNNCLNPYEIAGCWHGLGGIEIGNPLLLSIIKNISVTGNICIGNQAPGIFADNVETLQISNNLCDGNTEGLHLVTAKNSVVIGNICKNSAGGPGIYLKDFDGSVINSNQCFDTQLPKTQTYGLATAGTCSLAKVEGNKFNGNLTGDVSDVAGVGADLYMRETISPRTLGSVTGLVRTSDENGAAIGYLPIYDFTFGSEIIVNGDMETDPTAEWSTNPSLVIRTQVADERTGGAGSYSLDLEVSATGVDYGLVVNTVPLSVGTLYRLSGWAKNINAAYATIVVWDSAYEIQTIIDGISASSWTRYTRDFTCSAAGGYVGLVLHGSVASHFRYDDISIREILP